MAKRKEIAAGIRQEADKLKNPADPVPEMRSLMESLVYEKDDATAQKVVALGAQYVSNLKALPADKLAGKKDQVRGLRDNFRYLARWKMVPDDFAPKAALETLIKEQGWDTQKKK